MLGAVVAVASLVVGATAAAGTPAPGERVPAQASRRPLPGARRDEPVLLEPAPPVAPARLRADRPARDAPVVRRRQPRLRRLADAAAARARAGGGDRLGRRPRAPRPRAPGRAREELRRRLRAGHAGARDDRRGDHRGGARQRDGHRRPRAGRGADRRQGRRPRRHGLGRGRGARDPLGRRPRRPDRQHLTRRAPRPTQHRPRHVLAARGGGCALRGPARRRDRRRGRERRPGAVDPVALRELPRRAAPRPRRQRARAKRRVPGVLEPRRGLQRRRRARRGHHLDLPPVGDRRAAELPRAGLHAVRDRRLPAARRDVVRRPAGDGRRGEPARRPPASDGRRRWWRSSSGRRRTRARRRAAATATSAATG